MRFFFGVQFDNFFWCCLQESSAEFSRDNHLGDDVLASSENTIYSRSFLVCAVITRDRDVTCFRKGLAYPREYPIGGGCDHVVARRIAGLHFQPQKQHVANDLTVQIQKTSEPAFRLCLHGKLGFALL